MGDTMVYVIDGRSPMTDQHNLVSRAATRTRSFLAFVGLYTLVIALHEAGHLVAALSQGIKVEAWSVGLGPKLLSYRAAPGKGGFLKGKLSGPFSSPENVEGKTVSNRQKKKRNRRRKNPKGVEYVLRAIPMGGYISFPNDYRVDKSGVVTELDDPDLLFNRGPFSRTIVFAAGVVVNFAVAWACAFWGVTTGRIGQAHYQPGVLVTQVTDPKGGAAVAGIQPKDILLTINGIRLPDHSITSVERAVRLIRASEGKPVAIEVAHQGSRPATRMVQTAIGTSGKYVVGALLAPNLQSVDRRTADTLVEAAAVAFKRTAALWSWAFVPYIRLVSTRQAEDFCSGPVEIVAVREDLAQSIGPSALLSFVAISVYAAVINSLPVPGLDGGQMAFILAEILSGEKLDRDVYAVINGVGLLVVFGISLATFAHGVGIAALFQRILSGALRRSRDGVRLLTVFGISLATFARDLGIATLFQRILSGALRRVRDRIVGLLIVFGIYLAAFALDLGIAALFQRILSGPLRRVREVDYVILAKAIATIIMCRFLEE